MTGAVVGVAGCLGNDSHLKYSGFESDELLPEIPDNYRREEKYENQLTGVYVRDDDEKSVAFDVHVFDAVGDAEDEMEKYGRDAVRITDVNVDEIDDGFAVVVDDFAKTVIRDSNALGVVFGSERDIIGFRPDLGLSFDKSQLMVNHWKGLDP